MSLTSKAKKLGHGLKQPLLLRLTDKQQKELLDLRELWRTGDLRPVPMKALAELVKKEFELKTLNSQTLERFLNEPVE